MSFNVTLSSTLALVLLVCARVSPAQGVYLEAEAFLAAAFPDGEPQIRTLWPSSEARERIEELLGHRFASLRVRYWQLGGKTAWILDEIGKEKPITIGVTIEDEVVDWVSVLEFREVRGWEVRYPFFTDQFGDARLIDDDSRNTLVLDRRIDAITGATLSVSAVTRVVQVALYLSRQAGDPT